MVALSFNAQQVAPNASLEPVPSGVYDVVITNSAEKPTTKGDGAYIEFEMTIRSPDPSVNNRKVFDRLNIKNPNQQAVDIAYGTLSSLCHVTGRYQIQDTGQLHNVPFKAIVSKVERRDRPGEWSNEVKGYKDANGNDPGSPGAAAGGPAPQQPGGQPPYAQGGQPNGAQPQGQYGGPPQGQQPGGAPSWAANGQQPGGPQPNGGQPAGYANYAPTNNEQGQGAGYGNVPHPSGQQTTGPAPGHSQQTSEQHYAAGPTQGAPQQPPQQPPQGGQPPAWNGQQPAPQQPAPQQPAPQAQAPQPGPGAAPPWVQNQG